MTSLADRITTEILNKGLRHSKWAERYQEAFHELLRYKEDISEFVRKAFAADKQANCKTNHDMILPGFACRACGWES